ncbi:UNVERIFIED_CONTAM: hypothetical protein GTU68_015421 [Idotea baltica]|nr:hypothetical protein [Idotea baltica]
MSQIEWNCPEGVTILGSAQKGYDKILTREALEFTAALHRKFNDRRIELLAARQIRQAAIDKGEMPDFLPATKSVREGDWKVGSIPADLQDRRVEITGPVDRKMIINALNSGAKVFMADFEDSNSPTWTNNIDGQINLLDANKRNISYTNPKNGKHYELSENLATLMVRPRGWHLEEANVMIDGAACSAALFDFGIYFFHNAKVLLERGSGPYFYLPKMEGHLEARLWNDAFVMAQEALGIENGTIKATVLIETILASYELHEILFELKDHSAGLNCGRWDYIFSFIKRFRQHASCVLPDRAQVGMSAPFMKAYSQMVIKTCHQRGIHAMGGMAAQIPIKNDEEANNKAIAKVKADKEREVKDGHDGTWVAHPGLVKLAMDIFDEHMPNANQIERQRDDVVEDAKELIHLPTGTITERGVRENINVGILYIESWLRGVGAAAIYHLMEDAATAEISRTQLWQWIRHASVTEDGQVVTNDLVNAFIPEELEKIKAYVGEDRYATGRFEEATGLFKQLISGDTFEEFLTLPAYELI